MKKWILAVNLLLVSYAVAQQAPPVLLDRNSGIKPDSPRQVVRPGSPAQQKRSYWFLDTPQREQPDPSGRHLVSPEISGRLARQLDSPNSGQERFWYLECCDRSLQRQDV
jgi:hypothetical protein